MSTLPSPSAPPVTGAPQSARAVDVTGAAPVKPSERVPAIDIVRGFALFGILLVNMAFFNHSFLSYVYGLDLPTNLADQLAQWAIMFFAEGKFYSTFAFLFGLGMALQLQRFQERGKPFVPFYLRRLGVLLAIGLVHAYLFWVGDILILYSLLGCVLVLFFRNRRPKTLLVWTLVLLWLPLLINAALFGLTALARMTPDGAAMLDRVFAEQLQGARAAGAQADRIYATGSFVEITQQRARDMLVVYGTWPFMAFNVMAMMMLGLYAGTRRIATNLNEHLPFIRRVWRWGLIIGVLGNLVYVVLSTSSSRSIPSAALLLTLFGQTFGAPALSLFYMTSLVLLLRRPSWQRRLEVLAPVGRMAISNYLLQTLICTTLFYGYGFGLYGRFGTAAGLLLTLAIYALQIPLSNWWLKRFRFGPVEWLWRSLSYGKRQPMQIAG